MNAGEMFGKIGLVDRGTCTFIEKVEELQWAGAVAVIVVNNLPGPPIPMGGTGGEGIFIPAVMISLEDGEQIKQALQTGPVNATLVGPEEEIFRDSSFDNGIIAHEYGHGVSNRLTGGPSNVWCLYNEEQMGEGWSDWMALMVTMRPQDQATTPRGVGTFTRGQEVTGQGIRPAHYTTDVAVNGYTYGDTNDPDLSQPHGVGFVWATMLWDLTWALVQEHGLSTDLYAGSGGNNLAIQLVMDGMKLQPCQPGFVDGRDAILLADHLLTGGANQCLIWNVFAQRGLGQSASQGDPDDRFDQVEAFDLPPLCAGVGIGDAGIAGTGMRLRPNPASDRAELSLIRPLLEDAVVRIIGMDGRVAGTLVMRAGTSTLDLPVPALAPAPYLVELRSGDVVLKERLVVQ